MPRIRKGESKGDYMRRCIPYVMRREGLKHKEAVGKCSGMYYNKKGEK